MGSSAYVLGTGLRPRYSSVGSSALKQRFGAQILPIDGVIAEAWGRINAVAPAPVEGGLMAATAKSTG